MQTPERLFSSDAGLIFNPVRPDRTADFEEVLGKLREALQQSENAVRRQQLTGWKVFKSTMPVQGNIMYLFLMDPAVRDANYAISVILNEAFPTEVQELYEKFSGAYSGGQSIMGARARFGVLTEAGQTQAVPQRPRTHERRASQLCVVSPWASTEGEPVAGSCMPSAVPPSEGDVP